MLNIIIFCYLVFAKILFLSGIQANKYDKLLLLLEALIDYYYVNNVVLC